LHPTCYAAWKICIDPEDNSCPPPSNGSICLARDTDDRDMPDRNYTTVSPISSHCPSPSSSLHNHAKPLVLRHRTGRSAWLAIQTTETCPTATTRQSRRSHPIALRHHRRYTTMPNLTQVRLVSKGFVRQASKLGYSQVALSNLESRAPSVGHCNTMGTASTMNA
jgi:hypothetical protein